MALTVRINYVKVQLLQTEMSLQNFTGRINAFRVIERLERLNILGGQNTESVKCLRGSNLKFTNELKNFGFLAIKA